MKKINIALTKEEAAQMITMLIIAENNIKDHWKEEDLAIAEKLIKKIENGIAWHNDDKI